MKKLSFLLLSLLVVLGACKKETVDVTDLMKTVPSSAAGVVVLNIEGILKDAGCTVKDHVINPGEAMQKAINNASESDRKDILNFFNGDTGIDPKVAVLFYDSNRTFLTLSLYDVNKFCNFVESEGHGEGQGFTDHPSGVKVCGNVAVKGAQAWICLTSHKNIDADAIAAYSGLASSQSFLTTTMGEELLISEHDIRGWSLINSLLSDLVSRESRGLYSLSLGFLFEKAESVGFTVDFKKGEIETEAVILNDKGKPAKYQLPMEKVDDAPLKTLGQTCDAMMALTINQKLISKFEEIGNMFGGALFGNLGDTFKNVDGTVGLAACNLNNNNPTVTGVITTKGDISADLKNAISAMLGPVSQDGKFLKFSNGEVSGNLSVAECAEELKGCCLGIIVGSKGVQALESNVNTPDLPYKYVVIKFKPEGGSLELDIEVKTDNKNENALLSIIKYGAEHPSIATSPNFDLGM